MTDNTDIRSIAITEAHDAIEDHLLESLRHLIERRRAAGTFLGCQHPEADFSYMCDTCFEVIDPPPPEAIDMAENHDNAHAQQPKHGVPGARGHYKTSRDADWVLALAEAQERLAYDVGSVPATPDPDAVMRWLDTVAQKAFEAGMDSMTDGGVTATVTPEDEDEDEYEDNTHVLWEVRGHFIATCYASDPNAAYTFGVDMARDFSEMLECEVGFAESRRALGADATWRLRFDVYFKVSAMDLTGAIARAHDCAREMNDLPRFAQYGARHVVIDHVERYDSE